MRSIRRSAAVRVLGVHLKDMLVDVPGRYTQSPLRDSVCCPGRAMSASIYPWRHIW